MDKLLTFPGLQPIYLGDIDFLQESVRNALLLLLKGITGQDNPRCVLKKATPQSEGAICFDGEILPLKYGSMSDQYFYKYKIESAFSGQRTFKNQDTHDCYEMRYVVVSNGEYSDPDNVANFPTLQSIISEHTVAQEKFEFNYKSEDFESKVIVTKTGTVYSITGTFSQLRSYSGTLAYFKTDLPILPNDMYFVASAKTSTGKIVNVPLILTTVYQNEGIGVAKYIQISLPSEELLDQSISTIISGYFSLIIQ